MGMSKWLIILLMIVIPTVCVAKAPLSNEGDLSKIEFTGNILPDLTAEYIQSVKTDKVDQLKYLAALEKEYVLPEYTLQIKWLIESMAGKRNVKNKKGYEGHFQFGKYEQKLVGLKDPYDFKEAAHATVRLLRDYHIKMQEYATDDIMWADRSAVDFYMTHQQGFMGAGTQHNAIVHNTELLPRVRINMCGNIPSPYKSMVFAPGCKKNPGVTDQQLSIFFYRMWEHEFSRIADVLK